VFSVVVFKNLLLQKKNCLIPLSVSDNYSQLPVGGACTTIDQHIYGDMQQSNIIFGVFGPVM